MTTATITSGTKRPPPSAEPSSFFPPPEDPDEPELLPPCEAIVLEQQPVWPSIA